MTLTREQMEKAKQRIELQISDYQRALKHDPNYNFGLKDFEVALSCIQSLLDAGEVLLPLREVMSGGCPCDYYREGNNCDKIFCRENTMYNKARSEDIAIVAKKLAGLEEVIALVLSQLLVKDEPDKLGYTKARVISERVAQRLKGEGK